MNEIAKIFELSRERIRQLWNDLLDKLEEDNMSDLNPRQEKFISEYLKTLNVTQSAIKAGYSPHTASVQGSRLQRMKKWLSTLMSNVRG